MPKGQAKGSAFERRICQQLGLWWTRGKRDDIFWRSSNSGGRATTRHRRGKRTFGQYGDVQATDPIGQPLLDVCTIELKKGYNQHTIGDMLDKKKTAAQQKWEMWIEKAMDDSDAAGTAYFLLITCRDRRVPIVFLPRDFVSALERHTKATLSVRGCRPRIRLVTPLKLKSGKESWGVFYGMQFDMFLNRVSPTDILALVGECP